jgi:hypothetical protein
MEKGHVDSHMEWKEGILILPWNGKEAISILTWNGKRAS